MIKASILGVDFKKRKPTTKRHKPKRRRTAAEKAKYAKSLSNVNVW
jgi:hypothetical protein